MWLTSYRHSNERVVFPLIQNRIGSYRRFARAPSILSHSRRFVPTWILNVVRVIFMRAIMRRRFCILFLLMATFGACPVGCSVTPYRYRHHELIPDGCDPVSASDAEAVFEYGRPNKTLDRLAWVIGMPSRILPMSSRVNNHEISPETIDKLSSYLRENDLSDVLVRVNQYDPRGEWKRLRENPRISSGWKYTFGAGMVVHYTLFPGRVFGGDHYNAYTNTLYVNSDVPALLILEAAYAKDVHERRLPGPYSAIKELPVLETWRLSYGLNDTLGYAKLNDDWELERETYAIVYPVMGIEVALGGHSAISSFVALPMLTIPITAIGGAATGHVLGWTTIKRREQERAWESDDEIRATGDTTNEITRVSLAR